MHTESLPEKTGRLLQSLADVEAIGNFLLLGGTALALHAAHRISEDLDFAFVAGAKLPRKEVRSSIDSLRNKGLNPQPVEHPDAVIDFSESTLDLLDYQQDYTVDGVKLTFFAVEDRPLFDDFANRPSLGKIRIASQGEIFDSKAVLFSQFCRSRDVFDLWWLTEYGGFDIGRMARAFAKAGHPHNLHTAFARIREQQYAATDPGYSRLDPKMPDRDAARERLKSKIQAWIEIQAAETLRQLNLQKYTAPNQ